MTRYSGCTRIEITKQNEPHLIEDFRQKVTNGADGGERARCIQDAG